MTGLVIPWILSPKYLAMPLRVSLAQTLSSLVASSHVRTYTNKAKIHVVLVVSVY